MPSSRLASDGLEAYRLAIQRKFEGLVAKDLSSPYVEGRSSFWLKVKVHQEDEFVIGGFTAPAGSRSHFGALLLGAYDRGKLHFVGKVGTGFNDQTLSMLFKKFRPWSGSKALSSILRETATSPFWLPNSSPKFPTRNGPPTKNFASLFFSAFAMTKARRKSACRSLPHENQTNQINEIYQIAQAREKFQVCEHDAREKPKQHRKRSSCLIQISRSPFPIPLKFSGPTKATPSSSSSSFTPTFFPSSNPT